MKSDTLEMIGGLLVIAMIVALIVVGPIFTIWSVNVVMHRQWLTVDWPTWWAIAWIHMILGVVKYRSSAETK